MVADVAVAIAIEVAAVTAVIVYGWGGCGCQRRWLAAACLVVVGGRFVLAVASLLSSRGTRRLLLVCAHRSGRFKIAGPRYAAR